jgi:hypothetical protein
MVAGTVAWFKCRATIDRSLHEWKALYDVGTLRPKRIRDLRTRRALLPMFEMLHDLTWGTCSTRHNSDITRGVEVSGGTPQIGTDSPNLYACYYYGEVCDKTLPEWTIRGGNA